MKSMICPECKDVIPDGELRGNHKLCKACNTRNNRDDLVEIDTRPAFSPNPVFSSQPQTSPRSNRISLQDIPLVHFACWDGNDGLEQNPTLVIKPQGLFFLIIFAVIWIVGFSALFGNFIIDMLSDPASVMINGRQGTSDDLIILGLFAALFIGLGIVILVNSIKQCYFKTWIEVTPDCLLVTRGLRRAGKPKSFDRSQMTTVTMKPCSRDSRHSLYDVHLEGSSKITVASSLSNDDAKQLTQMLNQLMIARL